MMKKTLIVCILLLTSALSQAQFIKKKSINAQIGLGLSSPDNTVDNVVDDGFFLQGELVLKVTSWFQLRPYAGLILTNSGGEDIDGNPTDEKAVSKAFLLGGKARLKAPIPWVAPYVEFGIGTSMGTFETFTRFDDIDKSGIIYHIPFVVGLGLGRDNNVDLGLVYYFQPTVKQTAGAAAVGITIPL